MSFVKKNSLFDSSINSSVSFLSSCDLINKYNVKSVYAVPKVEKIVINFALNESLNAFNKKGGIVAKEDIQMQSFILLYFLSNFLPYINIIKIKNVDDFGKECSLRLTFSSNYQKNLLLKTLFVESWRQLKLVDDFKFFKKNNKLNVLAHKNSNTFLHTISVPISVFSEVEDFLLKSNQIAKEISIKITFSFSGFSKQKSIHDFENLIKNIPMFWVSG